MENETTSIGGAMVLPQSKQPHLSSLNHLSLPCRNLEVAKRFYTEVLGGELIHDVEGFAEVRIAGIIIGMAEQAGGWTGWDAEYPHYAFNIDGTHYELMKRWLEGYGIPHHPWTRDYKTALMYFRDPSGNLFELYCAGGYDGIKSLPLGPKQGGQPIPFGGLNYQWHDKNSTPAGQRPRLQSFNHLSIPCRNLEESRRFFTRVMGGEPVQNTNVNAFGEVRVAGAIVGLSPRDDCWSGRDAEFPHYAFYADAENFLPMIDWLKQNGVVVPGPWTRDGKKGLMYFRDPSGNLFEIYCGKDLKEAASFPLGAKQGGSYQTDFAGLFYQWNR